MSVYGRDIFDYYTNQQQRDIPFYHCPECGKEFSYFAEETEHPEESKCRLCGGWFYDDEMASTDVCCSCDQEEADYLKYCAFAGK
jgi:hypothetical protein